MKLGGRVLLAVLALDLLALVLGGGVAAVVGGISLEQRALHGLAVSPLAPLVRAGASAVVDVTLLEDHVALLIADHGRADFPLDLVERVDTWQREVAREIETR